MFSLNWEGVDCLNKIFRVALFVVILLALLLMFLSEKESEREAGLSG